MKAERLKQMEEYISKREFVTVEELSREFSVHKNTVRSDINELVEKGIVEKKYGGVSSKSYPLPTSFEEREEINVDSKRIIGRLAVSYLRENDIIFVDAGTTTRMIFEDLSLLPEKLTVITNSLSVINRCFQKPQYNVYALPGKLERQMNSFASFETIESVKSYNIQKAFMGVRGISMNGDLSSASAIDARLKEAVLKNSQERILMAESEKAGRPAMLNFAHLSLLDAWICERETEETQELVRKSQVKFISPQK